MGGFAEQVLAATCRLEPPPAGRGGCRPLVQGPERFWRAHLARQVNESRSYGLGSRNPGTYHLRCCARSAILGAGVTQRPVYARRDVPARAWSVAPTGPCFFLLPLPMTWAARRPPIETVGVPVGATVKGRGLGSSATASIQRSPRKGRSALVVGALWMTCAGTAASRSSVWKKRGSAAHIDVSAAANVDRPQSWRPSSAWRQERRAESAPSTGGLTPSAASAALGQAK